MRVLPRHRTAFVLAVAGFFGSCSVGDSLALPAPTQVVAQAVGGGESVSLLSVFKLGVQNAGTLALGAFGGTLLAGVLLSLFWKKFGPWKLLEDCQRQLNDCHNDRERDQQLREEMTRTYERNQAATSTQLEVIRSQYNILSDAVRSAGLGLKLGPALIAPIDVQALTNTDSGSKGK